MANSLREHFTISRELEYFTEAELTKQIGCSKDKWAITLVKEMVDNALDACESIGVEPHIKIVIDSDSISVQDNGPGIPENVITGSLIYSSTISDKRGYVSPSRGQQGNALKCLYAVPYVANGEQAQIEIQAHKTRYFYRISANKISQSIDIIPDVQKGDFVENGSFFKIHNFDLACLNSQFSQKNRISTKQEFISLIWKFSLCNPHTKFELIFDGDAITYPATSPQQKWTLKDALVSHWYSQEQFCDLISHNINIKPDMSVNEFVKMFNGLKTSAKQKEVSDKAGLNSRDGLKQFVIDNNGKQDIDKDKALNLLMAMNQLSVPVKPEKLGLLNKDHLKKMLNGDDEYSRVYEHKQSKSKPDYKGLPYTIDVVFQGLDDDSEERYSNYILCVNHTVLIDGRAYLRFGNSLYSITEGTHISYNNPVRLLVHITCPYIDFKDKGKNDIYLNESLFSDVKEKVALACKAWTKLQKNTKKAQQAIWKQEEREAKEQEREAKSQYLTLKEAHAQVIEEAYREAAGKVNIAKNRQVYYAARRKMLELTGKTSIDDNYFRDLTKLFIQENPELTETWDIIADARGTFIEPHNGKSVPVGTVDIRNYISSSLNNEISCGVLNGLNFGISASQPTFFYSGHKGKFHNVLFIEKEGFEDIIRASKIQERYDIAILASKGMSVDAARDLLQALYKDGVNILALHDFDIAGLNIARTLKEDTKLYKFKSEIEVIDIGLRGEDIEGLEREIVYYDRKLKDPRQMALNAGATEYEANILVQKYISYKEQWRGERVEINAMNSDKIIEFIEKKLNEHGVKKVVPENEVLEEFYKATHKSNMMDSVVNTIYNSISPYIRKIEKEIKHIQKDVEITPPENLQEIVRCEIEGTTLHWIQGIKKIATSKDADKDTQKRIEAMIKPILEEIKEKFAA